MTQTAEESKQRHTISNNQDDKSPSPDNRWSAWTTPTNDPVPFLHSTLESHSLINTGRVGQHSTSACKQTIPHISCPGDSSQPPTKSPSLTLSHKQQGVWLKGDGLRVRTITYGHCFPNDSGWEFLKLLRSVWRSFLKLHPKVGRILCCSKQIPGL